MKVYKIFQYIVLFFVSIIFTACSFTESKYNEPQTPISKNWPRGEAYDIDKNNKSKEIITWDNIVLDKRLKHIISIALDKNLTLKETLANIEAAKATYKIQYASEFPTIEVEGSGSKSRSLSGVNSKGNDTSSISQNYQANVGLSSYEFDFWGKAKKLSEAEFETYLSLKEAQRVSKISIISELINAWLSIAADQSLLSLSEKTVNNSKKSLDIAKARFKLGIDSEVSFYEAQTVYYQALADVESYKTQIAQDINALNLLVGEKIDDKFLPIGFNTNINYLKTITIGLPSEVLLNRPDIKEAEHNLKAAYANISVARAAYFPSISLTTTAGFASTALSNLFTGGAASVWSFVPSISLPIFDWGSKKASLEYAKAQRDVYLAQYDSAIQTAFYEIADVLARFGTIENQLKAQKNLVLAAKNSYFISKKRYEQGVDSYSDALTSQRTLYSAEQVLISLYLTKMNNRVSMYRVLAQEN